MLRHEGKGVSENRQKQGVATFPTTGSHTVMLKIGLRSCELSRLWTTSAAEFEQKYDQSSPGPSFLSLFSPSVAARRKYFTVGCETLQGESEIV